MGGGGRPVLNLGIGINTGDMIVGNMGSNALRLYSDGRYGQSCSRLEGINKEYGSNIIISEFTYDVVQDSISCVSWTGCESKAKNNRFKIYELLGEKKDEGNWKD